MAYSWKSGLPDALAIAENSDAPFATLAAVDGQAEAFSYSLSGGHRGLFEIDAHGVLSLKNALNYESSTSNRIRFPSDRIFTVMVRAHADDGERVLERPFVLTLQDENEFEGEWHNGRGYNSSGGRINENNDAGYQVAEFRARDNDRDSNITYNALEGSDANLFSIEDRGDGRARLYLKSSLDHETKELYSVIIKANPSDDSDPISRLYVLTLQDRDEKTEWDTNGNPTGATVSESAILNVALETFKASDEDIAGGSTATIAYDIRGKHRDDSYFQIDKDTGVLTLKKTFSTDETKNHYTVVVRAGETGEGGDQRAEQTFVLTVTGGNDHDTEWRDGGYRGGRYNEDGRNFNENNNEGSEIARFRATDGDRVDIDYSLSGTDAAYFSIDSRGGGGEGRLYLKSRLDFEDGHIALYSVVVNANSTDASTTISQLYILTLKNKNEGIEWETNGGPTTGNISENNAKGAQVADFGAIDPDAGNTTNVTYSIRGNHRDDKYFAIDKDTGILTVTESLNFEDKSQYTVVVRAHAAQRGGNRIEETFVLAVDDAGSEPYWNTGVSNHRPPGATLAENNNSNAQVADYAAVSGNGATIQYWISGPHKDYFNINAGNGKLTVKQTFDYENLPISRRDLYSVVVHASPNNNSLSISSLFVLTITDIDATATWTTTTDGATISENNSTGVVGGFAAVNNDGDAGATVTYGLLTGRNGRDYKYFDIDAASGDLTLVSTLNFESKERYTVIVRARADDGNDRAEQTFVLTVTDVNDATTWRDGGYRGGKYNQDGRDINENNSVGSELARFRATDGDKVDVTYSLTGDDAVYFSIDSRSGSEGRLYLKSRLDFEDSNHLVTITNDDSTISIENNTIYSVIVNATSLDGSATITQLYILTLNDRNEKIEWSTASDKNPTGQDFSENQTVAISEFFLAVDPDGEVSYSIRQNHRDFDHFDIDANTGTLGLSTAADYEEKTHYTVEVRAHSTDDSNQSINRIFVATIANEDEFATTWRAGGYGRGGRSKYNPDGRDINENNSIGSEVARFRASEGDDVDITYSLTNVDNTSTDADLFRIDSRDGGGEGRLYLKSSLDFEAKEFYSVIVNATSTDATGDTTSPSQTISQLYILTLNNKDDASWQADGNPNGTTISESSPLSTPLANFTAIDDDSDGGITYGLAGKDNSYFQINNDGVLSTKKLFTDENKNLYTVVVRAREDDGGDRIEQTFVLTITEENDHDTAWRDGKYNRNRDDYNDTGRNFNENNNEGSEIARFRATDGDRVDISYSLSEDDAKYFSIDSRGGGGEGRLYAVSSLDFEDKAIYSVIVTATSTDTDTATSQINVISQLYVLTLNDRNEFGTTWDTGGNLTGNSLSENLGVGISVADFGAVDGDAGATVTYSIRGRHRDDKYFEIDSATGVLSTKSVFDFEDRDLYTVEVRVQSNDGSSRLEQTFVLTIVDANDSPEWVRQKQPINDKNETPDGEQIVGIGEAIDGSTSNAVAGLQVAKYKAIDDDNAPDATVQITYSLTGTDTNYFTIDSNGRLFLTSNLDFEDTTHIVTITNDDSTLTITDNTIFYSVIVHATSTDDAPNAISNLFVLTLTDREESARWTTEPTGATLSESNTLDAPIATFNAIDGDGDGVTYSIRTRHRDDKYFAIDKETGILTVKSIFDFETKEHYTVVVRAKSDEGRGQSNAEQTFVLTIGDVSNTVAFTAGSDGLTISENNTVGFASTDRITDFNNGGTLPSGVAITYGLSGGDVDYFSVGATSGWFFLKSSFDYESNYGQYINNQYSVIITANANDDGTAITRLFVLTVTNIDNTRGWADGTPDGITLSENLAIGTEVYNINALNPATGGGSITFGISGGDHADYFNIGQNDGVITFASVLDFENPANDNNRYSVIINSNATIEGTAITRLFVLTITDVDNTTAFSAGSDGKTIDENNAVGFAAADRIDDFGNNGAGATITYGVSGDHADYFSIAATTGWLFVTSSFDYENPDSADNKYTVIITANANEEGDPVTQQFVLTIGDIDESVQWASGGNPAGNAIDENNPATISVADFGATDADGATVTYSLEAGGDSASFAINADTGILSTTGSLSFEYTTQKPHPRYSVVVIATATDGVAVSQTFILTINDVDEDLYWSTTSGFNPAGANIDENTAPSSTTEIARFGAGDSDNDTNSYIQILVSYSLGGDDADLFNIVNLDSSFLDAGKLYLKSSLDYENQTHHSIIVIAHSSDGSPDISRTFILSVNDVEDSFSWIENPATYGNNGTIAENTDPNTVLAVFSAYDKDAGATIDYAFASATADVDFFSINATTGQLYVLSSFDFENPDRSGDNSYHIRIIANSSDASISITQDFRITITDESEPVEWANNPTGNTLSENLAIGTSIADFGATDGDGATVTYSLRGNHRDDDYFVIDATTGVLTATSSFNFETKEHYTVEVRARSTDGSDRIDQQFVLTIIDVNEAPEWRDGGYRIGTTNYNYNQDGGTQNENNDESSEVARFRATDADDGAGITYSLSADDAVYFSIDSRDEGGEGRLYLTSILDFEDTNHTSPIYSVVITATSTDDSPTAISQTFILSLTNENEHPIDWETGGNPDGNTLSENLAIGTSIADFGATDGDAVDVTYELTGADDDYFAIDSATGILTTTSIFNFEDPDHGIYYSVVVRARSTDGGDRVTQQFVLTIDDEAEPVEWTQQRTGYGFAIAEHAYNSGDSVYNFNAVDGDGATVTFSLGGPDASYFVIDANTGQVNVGANDLDYEDSNHGIGYSIFITAHSTDGSASIISPYTLTLANSNDELTTWADGGNPTGTAIAENNAVNANLGAFITADADNPGSGDSHSYWLTGDDANFFHLTKNGAARNLRASESFDFENPTDDADGNARLGNLYTVVVNGRDTAGGPAVGDGLLSISQLFVLTITDIAPEPIVWATTPPSGYPVPYPEGNVVSNASQVWDFNAVDGDGSTVTYSLSGPDTAYFNINADTGQLYAASSFDYEDSHGIVYSVVINAHSTDGSASITSPFTLTLQNRNDETATWDAITGFNLDGTTIEENNAVNARLGLFFINDADNSTTGNKSYWLTGDDADAFTTTTTSDDFLDLRAAEPFDFEDDDGGAREGGRYTVIMNGYDSGGGTAVGDGLLHASQLFVLTVTDGDDPIVFAKAPGSTINLAENNNPNDVLFVYSAYDGDANVDISYSINAGSTGDTYFSINSETGQLYAKSSFDFEDSAPNSIQVTVIANSSDESVAIANVTNFNITDVAGAGLAPDPTTPDQPVGWNGKILFDGTTETIGGISDGIGNDGLVIIGNDLSVTQYDSVSATNTDLVLNNIENFADSFVGYTDADGNEQNHWFFVRDDATDNTGHIVFDADGLDVNLDSLNNGGATTTPDQINLLAGLNFNNDGDFNKPDDLTLDLNNNNAAALTHDQFLALIGGSNNIDFI